MGRPARPPAAPPAAMSSLSDSDVETLQQIGHDTVQSIVALVVESIMISECAAKSGVPATDVATQAIYFVLVVKAGLILLYVALSHHSLRMRAQC